MFTSITDDNIQRIQAVAAEKNVKLGDSVIGNIAMKYGDTPMRLKEVYQEVNNAIAKEDDGYSIPDEEYE